MSSEDNPLFKQNTQGSSLKHGKVIQPMRADSQSEEYRKTGTNEAVSVLRTKIEHLYAKEPDAKKK